MSRLNDINVTSKIESIIYDIRHWHHDRNLIKGSTDAAQWTKLKEECDELAESIEFGESPIDDIGDIIVVLINIAERNNLSIEECLAHAYNDIKDRRGRMIDGVFVKEKPCYD